MNICVNLNFIRFQGKSIVYICDKTKEKNDYEKNLKKIQKMSDVLYVEIFVDLTSQIVELKRMEMEIKSYLTLNITKTVCSHFSEIFMQQYDNFFFGKFGQQQIIKWMLFLSFLVMVTFMINFFYFFYSNSKFNKKNYILRYYFKFKKIKIRTNEEK